MIMVRLAEAGMSNEVRVEPHEGWHKLVLNCRDRLNAANPPMPAMLPGPDGPPDLGTVVSLHNRLVRKLRAVPLPVGCAVNGVAASAANTLDAQLDLERDCQLAAGQSADYADGVRAFLEKRAPVFRGRA